MAKTSLAAVAGLALTCWTAGSHLFPDAQHYPMYLWEFLTNPNFVVNTPLVHEFLGTAAGVPDLPVFHSRLTLAEGFKIEVYASGIPHPRMLRVTLSGDLLVTQPRKGRVLLLSRDADGDGQSDGMRVLMQDLHLPHGIELKSDWLYIGLAGAIYRVAPAVPQLDVPAPGTPNRNAAGNRPTDGLAALARRGASGVPD